MYICVYEIIKFNIKGIGSKKTVFSMINIHIVSIASYVFAQII